MSAHHLLFDFDGTLVDSLALVIELYNEIARRHRWRVLEGEDLQAFRQMDLKERFNFLALPMYRLPALGREVKRLYRQKISTLQWMPGVREALEALAERGDVMGIVSSNNVDNIESFLLEQKVPFFSTVQSVRGLFGKHRVLGKYVSAHRLRPEQVIYVGDEQRDVLAARRAGIRSIAVTWGADSEERLLAYGPPGMVRRPAELGVETMRLWGVAPN